MALETFLPPGPDIQPDATRVTREQPARHTAAKLSAGHPSRPAEQLVDSKPLHRRSLKLIDSAPVPSVEQFEPQRLAIEKLLNELLRDAVLRSYLRWIRASAGQGLRLIPVEDVLYFQADTKYTRVVTADAEALIRKPLRELHEELDPAVFWVIHRATIVNAYAIKGTARDLRGRAVVRLKQRDDKLVISEAHEHLFRQM